ncbi:MAG: phosphomannomutase/phosphoglucomutase [Bacteroidia bacterium]|nr:phosphomannomutase/phosphoglucomutase [Bacteroidia bacterium]
MASIEWGLLQNGAEVRGIAAEGIIGEDVTLDISKVKALGRAFVKWVGGKQQSDQLTLAIGMDSRLTAPRFLEALEQVITECGANVLNCGLVSTPALMLTTKMPEVQTDGAIMVTGSHVTFNRNGMKFFFHGDDIQPQDMSDIIDMAERGEAPHAPMPGQVHIFNLMSLYASKLRAKVCAKLSDAPNPDRPFEGLKVVVDAGNGAGGFYTKRILEPLGADTTGSQFLEPDGRFPNHKPNPEDYEAAKSIANAVRYAKADIGILFDADVDRVALVDSDGNAINKNELVAIASAIVLEEHPGTTIVTDSITSSGLSRFITEVMGGKHCRYQRGYKNVIQEAKRRNKEGEECWLAIETSGHAAFKDNNFYDDGAHFATRLLVKLAQLKREGKNLSSLIENMPVAVELREFRLPIIGDDISRIVTDALVGIQQFASQIEGWEEVSQNHEGIRVVCRNEDECGWFLIRMSLHEPEMPINIESDIKGGTGVIIKKLKMFFRNVKNIDSKALYIN